MPSSSRIACLLVLLSTLAAPAGAHATTTLNAMTLDGETVRLTDYFDPRQWTRVMVWTTYCTVCEREFPVVAELHRRHRDDDFRVLGLALDGSAARAEVARVMATRAPGFDSLVAEPEELAASYARLTGENFDGTPTYLLFDGREWPRT